jgi:hypothetical protein
MNTANSNGVYAHLPIQIKMAAAELGCNAEWLKDETK